MFQAKLLLLQIKQIIYIILLDIVYYNIKNKWFFILSKRNCYIYAFYQKRF